MRTRWTQRTLPAIVRFNLARCASLFVGRQKASIPNLKRPIPYFPLIFKDFDLLIDIIVSFLSEFSVSLAYKDSFYPVCSGFVFICLVSSATSDHINICNAFFSHFAAYLFHLRLISPSSIDHFILPIFRCLHS